MPFTSIFLKKEREYISYLQDKNSEKKLIDVIKENISKIPALKFNQNLLNLIDLLGRVESTDEFEFYADMVKCAINSVYHKPEYYGFDTFVMNMEMNIWNYIKSHRQKSETERFLKEASSEVERILSVLYLFRRQKQFLNKKIAFLSSSEIKSDEVLKNLTGCIHASDIFGEAISQIELVEAQVRNLQFQLGKQDFSIFAVGEIFADIRKLLPKFKFPAPSQTENKSAIVDALRQVENLKIERSKYLQPINSLSDNLIMILAAFINVYPAFSGINKINDLTSTSIETLSAIFEVGKETSSLDDLITYFKRNPIEIFFQVMSLLSLPAIFIQTGSGVNLFFSIIGLLGTLRDAQNLQNNFIIKEREKDVDQWVQWMEDFSAIVLKADIEKLISIKSAISKIDDSKQGSQDSQEPEVFENFDEALTKCLLDQAGYIVGVPSKDEIIIPHKRVGKEIIDHELHVLYLNLNEKYVNPDEEKSHPVINFFYENPERRKISRTVLLALANKFSNEGELAQKLLDLLELACVWDNNENIIKIKPLLKPVLNKLEEWLSNDEVDRKSLELFAKTICKGQCCLKLNPLLNEDCFEIVETDNHEKEIRYTPS